ncbi:nitroreductase family protein [Heliorestis convoluta]|uniref:Nitroreductase n=1 Tax=Heliorestis convoluta TaxID=356322 RepID=A0A5Q2N5Y0_9FIRM|nr:nitroreductase family protein [Heliorestis convoluta]QGG49289.1 nitroreductase [Heliorestis convoluta]
MPLVFTESQIQRCYKAIQVRTSRRKFNGEPLKSHDISVLQSLCQSFRPFHGLRAVLVNEPPDDIFTGLAGSYGKVKDAPAYMAFIGKSDLEEVEGKIGYLGEALILEATAAGLSTCWVAGFFCPYMVRSQIDLQEREKVYAVTPLGYTDKGLNFEEKTMSFLVSSKKRKSLVQLTAGQDHTTWPQTVQEALKAVQWAPSAVNRQPWRIRREEKSFIIATDGPQGSYGISKRLDCGIAMVHFEVALRYHGEEGDWQWLHEPDVAKWTVLEKQ